MRKALIATIVASALFAVGAFAANFTTSAEDVASGRNSVVACAPAVDVVFNPATWDDSDKRYEVTTATFRFVATTNATATVNSCDNLTAEYRIELGNGSGTNASGTDQSAEAPVGDPTTGLLVVTSNNTSGAVAGWPVSDIEGAAILIEDILIPTSGTPSSFGG